MDSDSECTYHSSSACCLRNLSLSVLEREVYLHVSLAHHWARPTILTPGRFHDAADTYIDTIFTENKNIISSNLFIILQKNIYKITRE